VASHLEQSRHSVCGQSSGTPLQYRRCMQVPSAPISLARRPIKPSKYLLWHY
jgi:hypothetical protein